MPPLLKPIGGTSALTRPSPIQINEILLRIFSYLSQPKLKTVARYVCRQWNFAAKELLHCEVRFDVGDSGTWRNMATNVAMATSITVGKEPAPRPYQRDYDPAWSREQWQQLMDLLHPVKPEAAAAATEKHDVGRRLRVQQLTMYVESWWIDDIASQTLINAAHLTNLTMYMSWFETGTDHIEWMLDQCPGLLSLSLIGCKLGLPDNHGQRARSSVSESACKSHTNSWPLRSLSITNLRVSPRKPRDLVPRLEGLTSISMIHIQCVNTPDSFQNPVVDQEFWVTLARHCLCLEAISFTAEEPMSFNFPVALFPFVVDFGMGVKCAMVNNPTWQALSNIHQIKNRLTSLKIMGTGIWCLKSGVLREFLCSAPSLLHLKVVGACVERQVLIDYSTNASSPCVWACRRLKTLHIDSNVYLLPDEWPSNRTLFGYLGRVCPELQEISVLAYEKDPYLPLTLSLLTRLVHLRQLELRFRVDQHWDNSESTMLRAPDFGWIQLNKAKPSGLPVLEKGVSLYRLSSLFHSISTIGYKKPRKEPSNYTDAARASTLAQDKERVPRLKKVEGRTKSEEWRNVHSERESQRQRMLQQQGENYYQTDYNRDIPMVDGLVDFEFMGSHLDVEACLQAQIWRFQQQQEGGDETQVDLIQRLSAPDETSPMECTRPWKYMEQFIFTISVYGDHPREMKRLESHTSETCNSLRQMRPDIEFLHRTNKVDQHLYNELQ